MRHEEVGGLRRRCRCTCDRQLAVCAGSCGPGNLHLINGLFDCHRSRVPVVAIAAHIPSPEIGSAYFQETHPEHLFRECSLLRAGLGPRADAASARDRRAPRVLQRGVAVMVIPGDVALRPAVEAAAPLPPA